MDVQSVIDSVTARIKETANVRVVFGDPVEVRDVTIIPVATVAVTGGGGGGISAADADDRSNDDQERGLGLGMHITSTPVGYIEVRDGEATMVDIVDKNKLAIGGLIIGGALLLTFAKLITWKIKHR